MICASCGAAAREGAAFCGSCGRPIIGYSVGQAISGSTASVPPVTQLAGPAAGVARTGDTGLYAGFWLRFVAAFIDGLLLLIPYGFLFLVLFASAVPMLAALAHTPNPNPFLLLSVFASRFLLFAILSLLGSWLYWSLLESSTWRATLGKKALGLYVTDLTGAQLTFGKASGRFFAGRGISYVPSLGGLYYLIDCIMAGCTEKKQALHDMIAGCLVQRNA